MLLLAPGVNNPSYATDQNTQFSVLNETTLVDVAVHCLINSTLISIQIFTLLQDDVSVRGAGCAPAAAFQFESRKTGHELRLRVVLRLALEPRLPPCDWAGGGPPPCRCQ